MLCYCGHRLHPGYRCPEKGAEDCPCTFSEPSISSAKAPPRPAERTRVYVHIATQFEMDRQEATTWT